MVFLCNSTDRFLQYFCFLAIKKELANLFNNIDTQKYDLLDEALMNKMSGLSSNLFMREIYDIRLTGFFNINTAEESVVNSVLTSVISRLKSSKGEMEIFYLDGQAIVLEKLSKPEFAEQCVVIDFCNTSWDELKDIINYLFSYYNITPTGPMRERAYSIFLPSYFYELATILNILDLSVSDKNNTLLCEKTFMELVKNLVQKRRLKSVIKKGIKTFLYWKRNQNITNNVEWKGFLKYKIMEVLEEDILKDLRIEEKINDWDELMDYITEMDTRAVKESPSSAVYNSFLSTFIFKYGKRDQIV